MLLHLSIRGFAIIDSLDLEFPPGFTALTGETGAGKSILVDALSLALGERAGADQVRAGGERAEVTAEFALDGQEALAGWLREQALEGDAQRLLLRRVVDAGGRSRAFINGHAATLNQLREAGEHLVDIHGQHAHQSLLKAEVQRAVLDSYGGLDGLAAQAGSAWREWQRLVRMKSDRQTHAAAREAERGQLAWREEELARLSLGTAEWEGIQAEHGRLAHAAGLLEGARSAIDALSEADAAALATVSAALSRLRSLVEHDAGLAEPIALLESGEANLREAVYALRHYTDRVELDPARLREVEERLEAVHATARRLRTRPEALPELLEETRARMRELDMASDTGELARQEEAARVRYGELAQRLTAGRKKAAAKLGREVMAAMKELAMAGGRFEVHLQEVAGGGAGGDESVEFRVAANPGGEPRPLSRVASGGELSRMGLAIQVIASRAAAVPTLVFDEVDAGIGGAVAEVVGRRLRQLGEQRQVLVVTHLPQVAAQAAEQWSVSKSGAAGGVASRVTRLDRKSRVEEIARMLGGLAITATTRKHAAEMLGLR